jgi:hypothetical protein
VRSLSSVKTSDQNKEPSIMSTAPNTSPASLVPPATRHALGLPAGSVRALLALAVVLLVCIFILISPRSDGEPIPIPAYMLYLLFLMLGHFFAAHGTSITKAGDNQPGPLYLPSGLIRLLIVGLLVATVAWKYSKDPGELSDQLQKSMEEIRGLPMLPVLLLGGFFLGVILHTLVGRKITPYWFHDLEAWIALLAFLGLGVEALIHFVINPSLELPLDTHTWQGGVAAIIAFYFGARS